MGWDHFWLAIAGEAIHGFGSGSVAVAMRTVVSQFFLENDLTFAHVRQRQCVLYTRSEITRNNYFEAYQCTRTNLFFLLVGVACASGGER